MDDIYNTGKNLGTVIAALNIIVLGIDKTICDSLVNATMCSYLIEEHYVLHLTDCA